LVLRAGKETAMKPYLMGALAAALFVSAAPNALAGGVGAPGGAGAAPSNEDEVRVQVTGRVESVVDRESFDLVSKGLRFRVASSPRFRASETEVRRGDRVRVSGELERSDRILAYSVNIVERGRGGRASNALTGTIRTLDRTGERFTLATPGGNLRVVWDEDTEFIRNSVRSSPREFREGDSVRIIGRRNADGDIEARRVLSGGQAGWTNGGVGEIVSLDSRNQEAEVDFDGEVRTVRLNNAEIRARGRRGDLNDLRLGHDVRVTGTVRGGNIDASLVELVRGMGDDRNAQDLRTIEGRVVKVGEERRSFRMDITGGEANSRVEITDETIFLRGIRTVNANALQDGQRVRIRARRDADRWVALRVEIL
jgi:uncharacterized protein DUF5666